MEWSEGARKAMGYIRHLEAEAERLRGLLATEEAERIRCRDGWARERAEVERLRTQEMSAEKRVDEQAIRAERAEAALRELLDCPVGGSGQRLPTPEVVARARAVLAGEVKGGWDEVYGDPKRWLAGEGKP